MRTRKDGQLAGQVFLYILGVIVVGLILLLGIRAVGKLQDSKCTVQETRFVTSLATAIEENKGRGISRVVELTPPCDVTAVCFVSRAMTDGNTFPQLDPSSPYADTASGPYGGQFSLRYGVIIDSVTSGVDTNVWVKSPSGYEPVSRFEVAAPIELPAEEPIRCVTVEDGLLRIRFKGKGLGVEVESAPRSS